MFWRWKKKKADKRDKEEKKKRNPLSPTLGPLRPHRSPAFAPYTPTHMQMRFIILFRAKARMIHHKGDLRGGRWWWGGHGTSILAGDLLLSWVHLVVASHVSVRDADAVKPFLHWRVSECFFPLGCVSGAALKINTTKNSPLLQLNLIKPFTKSNRVKSNTTVFIKIAASSLFITNS